ncbi:MAG: hypothetical protein R6U64_03225 [Bacteroidales bacterium]
MKKLLIVLVILLSSHASMHAQTLLDKYQSGTINLVPDTEYAQGVDWDRALESWNDTTLGRWVGDRKSLMVTPDGTAIVSHHFRDFYTVFSPRGNFEGQMQVKNKQGQPYQSLPHLHGVLDGNILYSGVDKMGTLLSFDRQGDLIKTLHLDYMARQIIPLPGRKLAVVGWVLWSDRVREFVAIVDYETNKEQIVWDHFSPRSFSPGTARRNMFYYEYTFNEGGMIGCSTMPFIKNLGMSHPPIIASVEDNLIVTVPETGQILTYDLNGKLVSEQTIDWAKNHVSVEEQREIQQKTIEQYRNIKKPRFGAWASPEENRAARDYFVKEMEKDLAAISQPITMPVFSTLIKDSDNNLLFFEFPKQEGDNSFNVWVYSNGGQFVAQSSFRVQDYELEIKPSKMVFHDGYIYALAKKNGVEGVPLRVMRFLLE